MTEYKFPAEAEIQVYVNAANGISIMQTDGHEEHLVLLQTKDRAVRVAEAILALAQVATFKRDES